jgi:hypothetical protein
MILKEQKLRISQSTECANRKYFKACGRKSRCKKKKQIIWKCNLLVKTDLRYKRGLVLQAALCPDVF